MLLGSLIALLTAASWSIAAVFYKKGEGELTAVEVNAVRCPASLAFLAIVAAAARVPIAVLWEPMVLAIVIVATLLALVAGDTLYLLSIKKVGVALATAASYTYPAFTAALSAWLIGERVGLAVAVGTAMVVMGVWLLCRDEGDAGEGGPVAGVAIGLAAAVTWAAGITAFRYVLFSCDPLGLALVRMIVLTALLAPVIPEALAKAGPQGMLYLSAGGMLGLGLGGVLFYAALALIGAARASTITAATPLFSALLSMALLKERLGGIQLLGIALISAGVALVSAD
ncbi:hypothetical protein B6U99_01460 [Candidatus Geothermarchaeota archaeon ex4572_27]|nr:MAG: hypothetical protein B6U99_01460 [Candidatus Geothermarchaeota archaeon ex4572_27]